MSEFNYISIATSTSNGLHKIELTTMNCRGKIHFIFIRSMAMPGMSPVITMTHIFLSVDCLPKCTGRRANKIHIYAFLSNKRIAPKAITKYHCVDIYVVFFWCTFLSSLIGIQSYQIEMERNAPRRIASK